MADFFFSNFKRKISFQISKMKVSIFSFQISKTQIFKNFSFQIFVAYFKIFHFPLVVWPIFFKFQFKFQNRIFCSIFPFPSGGMDKIFKIQKQKISIQISKTTFFISNFPCGLNFFSRPEVAKFIKRLQKLPNYPYKK
jgi:hypothetical protein